MSFDDKTRKRPRTIVRPSDVPHNTVRIGYGLARILKVSVERIRYQDEEGSLNEIGLGCHKDNRPCRVGSRLLSPWVPVDEPVRWIMIAGEQGYVQFVFEGAGAGELLRDLQGCGYATADFT